MLWELTMRFKVLPPAMSAAVLGLVVAVATALSWRRAISPDFVVTYAAVALTALTLSVVTHVMMPFLLLILVMVAMCEYKSLRQGGQGGVRVLVAAVADCAAWFLIVIYRNPASSRADYPALGTLAMVLPASLLFLISALSVGIRTTVLRRKITVFDTIQCCDLVSALGHDPAVPRSANLSAHSGHCMPVVCVGLLRGCMGHVPLHV